MDEQVHRERCIHGDGHCLHHCRLERKRMLVEVKHITKQNEKQIMLTCFLQ